MLNSKNRINKFFNKNNIYKTHLSKKRFIDFFGEIMTTTEMYYDLKKLRDEAWLKVLDKKLSLEDYVYTSFNFLRQQRYKPLVKAHDKESIMYNYIYWMIQIERKILMEKELIKMKLGNEDLLNKVLFMHVKRRDQMVRRILGERGEKVKALYLVFDDTVEIIMESGEILYSSQENLEKIKIEVKDIKRSQNPAYAYLLKMA